MSDAASVVVTCGSCGSRLRFPMTEGSGVGKCPRCGVRVQMSLPPKPAARVEILSITDSPAPSTETPAIAKASPAPAPSFAPAATPTFAFGSHPITPEAMPAPTARPASPAPKPMPEAAPVTFPAAPRAAESREIEASTSARSIESHAIPAPAAARIPAPRRVAISSPPPAPHSVQTPHSAPPPPPAPGTFLFFSADASAPQVRTVPASRAGAMQRAKTFRVAGVAIAALIVGAAACVAAEWFGGAEFWVVKRSAVAWFVGMMTAAAMMVADPRRISSLRLLSAATSSSAVITARLLIVPAPLGAIDALLMALAFAGSTAAFILAEDKLKPEAAIARD